MPVKAIKTGIQFSADKPLPTGCIAWIESRVPVFVPCEKICKFFKAFRKVLQTETVVNRRIGTIGLADKFRQRVVVVLFLPMYGIMSRFFHLFRHISHSL